MNVYKKIIFSVFFLFSSASADVFDLFLPKLQEGSLDIVLGDKKEVEVKGLEEENVILEEKEKKFWEEFSPKMESVQADILKAESKLTILSADSDFYSRLLLSLKPARHALSALKATWKALIAKNKEHIVILQAYLADPNFSTFQFEKKSFYSFENLQILNEQIAAQDEKVQLLEVTKNGSQADLATRKNKAISADITYKEKLQQQIDSTSGGKREFISDIFNIHQKGELLDAQVLLARCEKELADLRIKEEEVHFFMLTSQLDVEEKKLQALTNKRDLIVRMSLRVDEKDVLRAKMHLAERKKQNLSRVEELTQKIEGLVEQAEIKKSELRVLMENRRGSSENTALFIEWAFKPATAEALMFLGEMGVCQEELHLLERTIELLKIQIDLERTEFMQDEISFDMIQSWYHIKLQHFKTNEEFAKELKRYENFSGDIGRERVSFEEKRKIITNRLNVQNKALSSIKELQQKLQDTFASELRLSSTKRTYVLRQLETAHNFLVSQGEVTGKLIEISAQLLAMNDRILRQIAEMNKELKRVSLWQRSGGAISREGLENLIPDVRAFVSDVRMLGISYIKEFNVSSVAKKVVTTATHQSSLFLLLIKLCLVLLLFIIMNSYLLVWSVFFTQTSKEIVRVYQVSLFCAMLLEFVWVHLTSIFIWTALFFMFGFVPSLEVPSILFFLFSIPYLLYLSRKFVIYVANFNKKRDYCFFGESFAQRFISFLSLFLYATVTILFFRESYILATYTKSELPEILLALYSIIIRVLLLAIWRKEDFLNFIPTKTPSGNWLWNFIDNYYHPLLFVCVVLMIMMDPYIGGYNQLVFYFVRGIVGTVLVSWLLFELYLTMRRASSSLLFSSDGETLKERFQISKTLYSVAVIVLFMGFLFITVLCIAWLWKRPIPFRLIVGFFKTELFSVKGASGQLVQTVIMFDLLKTIAFIPLGFLVGFITDRFILHRIFSVLLVNPGIHNAVSTISYYIVIISVITVGMWAGGFGFVIVFYAAPILVGMIWALRDVFNDFVAYFIIIIQRPLKVGDYIKLDEETCGVVRSITPRAVILRRKTGFCLIIPNSRIIRDTIINWDYNLSFISCPDIIVHIAYKNNPEKVKEVLFQAVDATSSVLKSPAPIIRLDEFGEYGFTFMVRPFVSSEKTLLQWQIASDVRLSIIRLLRENGMEIAIPVRISRRLDDASEVPF